MRYFHFLALLGVASVNAQSMSKCAADNCLRAIRASAFPNRSPTADCRSFFRNYVTVTVTATATLTQTDSTTTTTTIFNPAGNLPAKRQAGGPPPGMPAYASPCSGVARYSSACACIGVTETADPSITTMTVVSSTTKTVVATATASNFVMQLQDVLPGRYIAKPGPGTTYPAFTTNIVDAAVFRRLPDGHIEHNGVTLKASPFSNFRDWIWIDADNELTCDIDVDHMLDCVSGDWGVMGVYIWSGDGSPYLSQSQSVAAFEATGGGKVRIKALPPPAAVPAP
ncbi:hypothetical protein TWF281_007413 [Arthrobotrys megalospora]